MDYGAFLKNKRALSRNQLIESNFPYKEYSNEIEEGNYQAVLDMKSWGKSPCLHCYFTLEDKSKIIMTVYQNKNYKPNFGDIDLSDESIKIGNRYELSVGKSVKGKTVFNDIKFLGGK